MNAGRTIWMLLAAAMLASAAGAQSIPRVEPALEAPQPKILEHAGFDQKPGAEIPLDLTFRDEEGMQVKLGDYFGRRPAILTLVYYECPMLCNELLNGLVQTMKSLSLQAGSDFNVVTVSFNPDETHVVAAKKRANYLKLLARPGAEQGWHFLTGESNAIQRLTEAVGFKYAKDPESGEYAHGSGIMIVTPEGKVSRYLFGVQYDPRDLKLALVEASSGRIGTVIDRVQLFCFQYNHELGRYSTRVMAFVQVGCALTILSLGTFLVVMFRREAAHRHAVSDGAHRAGV